MRIYLLCCLLLPVLIQAQTTWNVVYSNPNHQLVDIQFTSPTTGYVIGMDNSASTSFILKTTDGGQTWTSTTLPLSFVNKLHFYNDSIGYIAKGGVPMRMMQTLDGGQTWLNNFLPDSCFITQGLVAINDSTGYYINNAGQFRRFRNYGTTITRISDTLGSGTPIVFPSPTTGYFSHYSEMYKTTDRGANWSVIPTNLADGILTYAFTDTLTGYAIAGNGSSGSIVKTVNGAQSWQQIDAFYGVTIAALNQTICCVNDTSAIRWSSDGGQTWANEYTGVSWIGIENYVTVITPGYDAFIINGLAGQIIKRSLPLGIPSGNTAVTLTAELFPNPATNGFDIKTASSEPMAVTIHSITGKMVLTTNTTGHVDTNTLAAGCYFVEIKQNDFSCVKKLILK